MTLENIENGVYDALVDIVTAPSLTPFRANMIAREHGVQRIVRAIAPSVGGTHIGVGVPGGTWQWAPVATVASALGA